MTPLISRLTCASALLFFAGCQSSNTFHGKLVPQMGAALPDTLRVLAKADPPSADMTCRVFEATTEPSGDFRFEGLCADTDYQLLLTEKALMMEGTSRIDGVQAEGAIESIRVWPAPAGDGVAILTDGVLKGVSTYTDVRSLKLLGSEEEVLYPRHKPNGSVAVDDGSHLIIAGKSTIDRLVFRPLIEETVERNFSGDYVLGPHFYVGTRFSSDTEVERLEASLDSSKITDIASGDRTVRYIAHDALAPGNYALMGDQDQRMYVISFGPQPAELVGQNE